MIPLPVGVTLLAAGATGWAATRARAADRAFLVRGRLDAEPARAGGPPVWFVEMARLSEVPVDAARAWPICWRAALLVGGWLALRAPQAALGLVGVVAVAAPLYQRAAVRRAAAAFHPALLVAIDRLIAAVGSGASLPTAIHEAGSLSSPVGRDLALVSRRHRQGQGLQVALDRWAAERPGTGARLVADALALAGSTGGSQRRALEGVRATLRDRQALGREVRALGSQARASTAVLVATPIAFSGAVALADSRVAAFLTHSPYGWACTVAGLALDVTGALWMRRLTRSVL